MAFCRRCGSESACNEILQVMEIVRKINTPVLRAQRTASICEASLKPETSISQHLARNLLLFLPILLSTHSPRMNVLSLSHDPRSNPLADQLR